MSIFRQAFGVAIILIVEKEKYNFFIFQKIPGTRSAVLFTELQPLIPNSLPILRGITKRFSCQGKSETLGFYIDVDEIGYCYPVGDHSK